MCHTMCGHIFHKKCLMEWFETEQKGKNLQTGTAEEGTCPTCRREVTVKALYPLYFPIDSRASTQSSSTSQNSSPKQSVFSFSNSNKSTTPTAADKSDLEMRLELVKKDLESMTKKMLDEKERADINQAIINSLENSNQDNNEKRDQLPTSTGFRVGSNNLPTDNNAEENESQSSDDDQGRGLSLRSTAAGIFNLFRYAGSLSTANDDDDASDSDSEDDSSTNTNDDGDDDDISNDGGGVDSDDLSEADSDVDDDFDDISDEDDEDNS